MRIGILTGGGDVPGLNPAIKTVAYRGESEGHEILGIRRGWMGLLHYNPDDPESPERFIHPLNKANTRTIDRTGGTFLHTSRTNPGRVRPGKAPAFLKPEEQEPNEEGFLDYTPHVLKNLEHLKIDVLIPIGGEDTLGYAARLHREGFPIVSIPKTMDNDVFGTDYCIGFSTAVTRSVRFIHQLRSTAGSHERIGVVELFGRHCGETSLISAYLAGVDRAIIPEAPYDPERLAHLALRDKALNPNNYAVITVSDGSRIVSDKIAQYTPHLSLRSRSHVLQLMTAEKAEAMHEEFDLTEVVETGTSMAGSGMVAAELLQHLTGEEVFLQSLTYLLRTGSPDGQDLLGATNFAMMAARLVREGKFGRMTAFQHHDTWTDVDLNVETKGVKTVDVDAWYDVDNYQPKVKLIWSA